MPKVLVATEKPFATVAIDKIRTIIEDAGFEFLLLEKYSSKSDLLEAAAHADALIVRSDIIDKEIFEAAKNLKIVVRAGAGYDNIDLSSATEHNVIAENTPGQNSNAVAELVFGMAVMAARNMFNGTSGYELKDKSIGIHAFGQVGRNVARIAKGFGMKVEAYDPFCPSNVIEDAGVTPVEVLSDLYRSNRYVSIHIPATPQTIGSIGYELISSMPKNGILINTARKEVIDETGLVEALANRPDLKYVADVKPNNADELLQKFPSQVFFTPKKMGAQTSEANINAGIAAAKQVVDFLKNGKIQYKVN